MTNARGDSQALCPTHPELWDWSLYQLPHAPISRPTEYAHTHTQQHPTRPHYPVFPQAIQPRSWHHNRTGFRVWKLGAERQPRLPPSRKTRSSVPSPLLTCGGRPSAGPRICSAGRDGASRPWAGREDRVESLGKLGSYPPETKARTGGGLDTEGAGPPTVLPRPAQERTHAWR